MELQVGLPVVKESNEHGQPVTATTARAVTASTSNGASTQVAGDDDEAQPRLTDWKIEMNPRQEYVDPIRMHYSYAGGVEGNSIIQWFREVCARAPVGGLMSEGSRRGEHSLCKVNEECGGHARCTELRTDVVV